jgi:multidrug resistance protein, MATE family
VLRELPVMLRLAWPVILAELGWITMGIVDTIVVRRLGPAAIGAVGTGSTIFITVMVLGIGTLLALDTFVSQNFGAGRIDECHRWLFAGLQLAAVLSVATVLLTVAVVALLPAAGIHPAVLELLAPYLQHLVWSAPPLLVYTVCRRYLQAMNLVRPVMAALLSANVINAVANWILVYGRLGMPAFGVNGSAYATVAARIYMAAFLWAVIVWNERRRPSGLHDVPFVVEVWRIWRLLRLGLPAALQVALEVGVFAAASALAARITPLALAANQIALNVASFFFMIPFGLSSAAAVRVGQALGRGDRPGARRSGMVALLLGLVFALGMSTMFTVAPGIFLGVFTEDAALLRIGATVLFTCALFQPFDAVQTVATGALRGWGDTRWPMLVNLIGHWAIGLPVAYVLCFWQGWGISGLWAGLGLGIVVIGTTLMVVWQRTSRPLPI